MKVIRNIDEIVKITRKIKEDGYSLGMVPTMGCLHEGHKSLIKKAVEKMTNILCGVSRPGHFRGVCTVLTKLFTIVRPDRAYFGEKDIQQLAIVKRMVKDFNFGIDIIGCPIIREDDGLAKSSRNTYLNEEERAAATVLRRSILEGKKAIDSGNLSKEEVLKIIKGVIEKERLAKIDYVEIIDFDTFDQVETIKDNTLIAMAVYIGKTRLIDNLVINL